MSTDAPSSGTLRYRAHIDGLRGMAVAAVVLYHTRVFGFPGGFVGVDVFFVISGFLIASIILRDIQAGTFSLGRFWERRIRRIFPALFVMMTACLVAAHFFILYPPDYYHFGGTLIAQSLFASNVMFMRTDNYFDQPSHYSPLLHTWSLSVEEQFYVLFPLLILGVLWAIRLLRKAGGVDDSRKNELFILAGVVFLTALSFLVSVWLVNIKPATAFTGPLFPHSIFWSASYATAGFYLLPSRAWELGIGIIAALVALRIRSRFFAEIVSLVGILSILAAIFFINDNTPFPGIIALLPTFGALGIIVANEEHVTSVGKILSTKLLVAVGLISYSLYLWHWPIFVFANLAVPVPTTPLFMIGLIALSVGVSWLSYMFVEKPFRGKTFPLTRIFVFIGGVAIIATLSFAGILIERTNFLFSKSLSPAASATLSFIQEAGRTPETDSCFQLPGDDAKYGGFCRVGDKKATSPQFVVWGDSHALALTPLFDALGKREGMQGVVFDGAGCMPIIGAWTVLESDTCRAKNEFAMRYITDHASTTLFLVSRWSWYVMGGPDGLRIKMITDVNGATHSAQDAQDVFARHFIPMAAQLTAQGREVYIVKQVPEQFDFDPRAAFYKAVHTGQVLQTQGISASSSAEYQARANVVIDAASEIPHVYMVDPATLLCKSGFCALRQGSTPLYLDESHLNAAGALALEPLFSPIFARMRSAKH